MKAMKKVLATVLAMAMAATAMVGCGEQKETASSASGASSVAAKAYEKEVLSPGKIIVGISADYPPYESLNITTGKVEGFDVDMANALAKHISKDGNPVEMEFKNMDFHAIVGALQAGQVDIGVAAFTYDPDRKVLFSDTYLTSEQLVVVAKGSSYKTLDDLAGKKIGAGTETTGAKAAAEHIKDAEVTSPGDYTVMFEALKAGALDAVVCDGQVAKNYAKTGNFDVFPEALIKEENKIIIKEGNEELYKEINAAIKAFNESGEVEKLMEKWGIEG